MNQTERCFIEQAREGLQNATGDRLVDVIEVWGSKIQYTVKDRNPDRLALYAQAVVDELIILIRHPDTDIGLRGVCAETLLYFLSFVRSTNLIIGHLAELQNIPETEYLREIISRQGH